MKKTLNASVMMNELKGGSVFFKKPAMPVDPTPKTNENVAPVKVFSKEKVLAQNFEQETAQPSAQMSNTLSKDAIELLVFNLRHEHKVKVNAEVPLTWKTQLDDLAHQLRVGKYDIVLYIIAQFLEEHQQ